MDAANDGGEEGLVDKERGGPRGEIKERQEHGDDGDSESRERLGRGL
jgi:hypothetical protein